MAELLDGIRVLDLTRGVAGPFATKLLGDYGADVLKVEPLAGDPARHEPPFFHDTPHPETSALFLHLNTNKRSVTLDLERPEAREIVTRLARDADVVVEDFAPGQLDTWGIGWAQLSAGRDDLVLASITPFGQSGPYRDYLASEITLQAMGGPLHLNGIAEREPLKLAGHVAHYHAGAVAAFAMLLARTRVEGGGAGDHIDLAVYECQAGFRDRRTVFLTHAAYTGRTIHRPTAGTRFLTGVRPAIDGYVNLFVGAPNHLNEFLALIGRPDLVGDPEFRKSPVDMSPDFAADVEVSYLAWLMRTPKQEALAAIQALGILGGAILTTEDLARDPHYRGRGAWETIDHPHTGPIEYPGRQLILSETPRTQARHAPLLGEHNREVLGDQLGYDEAALARLAAGGVVAAVSHPTSPTPARRRRTAVPAPSAASRPAGAIVDAHRLPLAGVRVAEITVVWAGPHVTQLLAEWGADVVRVEPVNRIQPYSRGAERIMPREQGRRLAAAGATAAGTPGYPDDDPGDDPWNRSASFNSHARNKRSMACDVMSPEGREAFLRLIEHCDVFVENNVPATIERAGITYEALRERNPGIVVLRMPAFGLSGPYKNYRGFGTHVEGMIGHHYLRGYPDLTPDATGDAFTADAMAGVMGALAVTMALRHRDRTGQGQQIEMPLAEAFLPVLGQPILDYTMNGHVTPPQGNGHPWRAPHGIYPCSGDDQWIAIDVGSDDEFVALCRAVAADALADDARFATIQGRRQHAAALDAVLATYTATHEKEALFQALQAAGVTVAPVHDELEALADPQLNARGFFEQLDGPSTGAQTYPGLLFKMRDTPNRLRTPPVRLGEHNEQIYLDLLGYSRDEYEALIAKGLVGTTYPPELLPARD